MTMQEETAQLCLKHDAVVAKLAGKEQELAAAMVCLHADSRTISTLQGEAHRLEDWASFYRQQLVLVRDEAKVCMLLCWRQYFAYTGV